MNKQKNKRLCINYQYLFIKDGNNKRRINKKVIKNQNKYKSTYASMKELLFKIP